MASAEKRILRELQARGEATRPQLAAATGLSLVMVNQVMAGLCRSGAVSPAGETPSGGGRPAKRYRFNIGSQVHALIQVGREGNILKGQIEELDLSGRSIRTMAGHFAYLDTESFDGWLDTLTRRHALHGITLYAESDAPSAEMISHLKKRYACRVQAPGTAAVLSERREGELTLSLPQGSTASCAVYRHGRIQECGDLSLLPLPREWQAVPHTDRAMLEETVANMLRMLTCILSPTRICLHTPDWPGKLKERIRYNAGIKLKGQLPPIRFATLTKEGLQQALRRYATKL